MPYIGNAPYQGLVDSGNIVDGGVQTIDLANSSVTTAKVADGGITTAKLAGASVTAAKLASDVTDLITVGGSPKITSVVVTNSSYTALDDTAVDVAGGYIKITGTGFSNGCQVLINNTAATSVTFISATEVRAQVPATSAGTYVIYVVNSDGGVGIRVNGITFSSIPAWSTGSTLSSAASDEAISIQLSASSNSAITYTLQAGSTLPTGLSLSSSGLLTGTIVGLQNETTYNFTVLATDVENQDTSRAFSITITVGLPDDYYKSVVLHLPGNGTNLATNNQFLDGSTNNFSITRSGNATQGTFSPFSQTGWGNYFDGSGDALSVQASSTTDFGTSNFTIEAWVYLTSGGANRRIYSLYGSSGSVQVALRVESANTIRFFTTTSGIDFTSTATITLNAWSHIAIVRNGSAFNLYLNGTSVASGTSSSSMPSTSTLPSYISGYDTTNELWLGYISNLRVVKGTAVYTSAFTPPTAPLTAITNTSLLTCQSNRFIDASTNNFTITRNGDTRVVAFSPFNPTASWSAATYGGSGYFDGSGDYISTTTSATFGTSDFTLDWWVYHIAAPNPCWLWDGAFSSGTYPQIFITTSGTSFRYLNGAGTTLITATITNRLNEWVHYRICRSGSTVRLFINGVYIAQATDSTNYSSTFRGGFGARARDGLEGNQAYFGGFQAVMTALSTTNDNFTPPSGPMTLLSNTVLLLNFTNAGIYDATSKNDLETVGDAKISTTQSKWGGSSIAFDGTGDYLLTNSITGLQALGTGNFTIEMWAYWNSLPGSNNFLIDYRPTTTNGAYPCLYLNGTALYYYVSAANQISATNAVATGAWYHIALCRAQNNTKLFVNGLQVGSTYADTNNYLAGTGRPYIGINGYDATGSMNGYIDDLRITRDVARYWYNFTPPAKQFKVSYGATPIPATDEYFDYTTLLLAGNGGNTLQNNSFVDSSTNNFTITRSGNTTQGTFSPFSQTGWSNYFAGPAAVGNDHYLLIPSNAAFTLGTGDFTFECWFFNYYDGSGNAGFIDLGDANTAGSFAVFLNDGNLIVRIGGLGNDLTFNASSLIQAGIWYHLAVVRSGSTLTTYVDGVAKASGTRAQNITQNSPYIGAIRPTYGIRLQGNLSNVRLVKGTAVYTSNFTPPTTPLTNITNTSLLTCQSNRFVDNSSNNHAFTINGTPSVQAFSPFAPAAAYSAATNGGSGYFDGTGDYLKTTGTVGIANNAFTICCWFYPLNSSVIGLFDSGPAVGGVFRNYPVNTIQYQAGGTSVSIQDDYQVNAWNWMNITKSGSSFTVYINGVNAGSGTCASTMVENQFTVGTINNGADGNYLGYISDFQILNTSTIVSVPTAPIANASGKTYLLNFTNAAIIDNTAKNDLETVGNAQISTTQSKFGGGSLYFDGNGDTLVAPDNINYAFGTGDFTIEFWAYSTYTGSTSSGILDTRSTANSGTGLFIANDGTSNYRIGYGLSPYNLLIVSGRINNQWQHVAFVRYSSVIMIFIDGILRGSVSNSINFSDQKLRVSGYVDAQASPYGFSGYLDDLRITKGIARYVQNFTPPSAALQLL